MQLRCSILCIFYVTCIVRSDWPHPPRGKDPCSGVCGDGDDDENSNGNTSARGMAVMAVRAVAAIHFARSMMPDGERGQSRVCPPWTSFVSRLVHRVYYHFCSFVCHDTTCICPTIIFCTSITNRRLLCCFLHHKLLCVGVSAVLSIISWATNAWRIHTQ